MQPTHQQAGRADQLLSRLIAQSAPPLPPPPGPERKAAGAPPSDGDTLLRHGGTTLGGVHLLSLIGEGGMGRVYLGHHQTLDIEVAVKVMRRGERAQAERFVNEARMAAQAQHANIVRTLHAGYEGERLFLVQEYVAGINLKNVLRQSGPLPWTQAVHFAVQAARGLGAAHQAGIVHRDIKPSNLLITPHCTLKIVDLGLAYNALHGPERPESATILGTPAYMAPEQARDCRKAGPRADVYSLGVTLYHMLSGDVPYKRSSQTNLLLAHIHEPVPDIGRTIGGLPPPLVTLLARMLAKDPAARPADGDELGRELDVIIASFARPAATSKARTPDPALPRGPRRLAGIAGVVGAVIALVLLAAVAARAPWWHPLGTAHARSAAALSALAAAGAAGAPAAPAAPAAPRPGPAGAGAGPPSAPAAAAGATADPRLAAATAGAGPAAAAPAAGAGEAGSSWQTPPRALVVRCPGVPPEVVVAVHAALIASGLPVIDGDLRGDPRDAEDGRGARSAVPAAPAAGRPDGLLALDIAAVATRIEVRAELIASGELVCDALVDAAQVPQAIARAVAASTADLPARGWLVADGQREPGITLGIRHGVRLGDRFAVQAGDAAHPGAVAGSATVVALARDSARVELDIPAAAIRLPALVSRLPPPAPAPSAPAIR